MKSLESQPVYSFSQLRQGCYSFYLQNTNQRFTSSSPSNPQTKGHLSDLKFNKMARNYFLEQKLEEAEEDMKEEEEQQKNDTSESDSDDS